MKSSSKINKGSLGIQVGLILLGSAAVGLAYNALNPAGLSWGDSTPGDPEAEEPALASLYRVETISARLVMLSGGSPTSAPGAVPTVTSPQPTPGGRATATAVRTTWEKMQPLIERGKVVLVDSRSRLSYHAGHIPGAVNLPTQEIESEIGKFIATYLPPDARLLVYCSNAKCASSSKLAAMLTKDYGYDDVQYIPGGYLEWLQTQNREAKRNP